ncbi:hypothetical protein EUX98_g5029 [Antrodiella citrinella]|uniref:Uncharacterized protein n=1 Tax=Antrodiella citrinella TaxID=2447956 RepID=A0A4S4MUD6_9APHY|nr:hypothetical protein EUX98_g5029 [Antrodiella citrinella]
MAHYFEFLVVTLLVTLVSPCAYAVPLSETPEEAPPPVFALWLCLPFLVLATVKLVYIKFRRAQSIHACGDPGAVPIATSTKFPSIPSIRGLGFKLPDTPQSSIGGMKDITGYLVGFLGSPEWETRIRRRVDRVVRRSQTVASTVTSPRISLVEHTSSVSGDTRTSKGTQNVSQTNTTSSRRQSSRRSGSHRSRSASVSFLEMQTPKVPIPDIHNCGVVHPMSPACTDTLPLQNTRKDSLNSGEETRWRRRRLSLSYFSPTVVHIDSPPAVAAPEPPKRSLDKSIKSNSDESHGRSYSKTPSFQDASTSSNVSSDSVTSLPEGEITMDLSVSQAPASPNPEASVLSYPRSVSESLDDLSYIISPDAGRSVDWSVEEIMKVPRRNSSQRRPLGNSVPPVSDGASSSMTPPMMPVPVIHLVSSPDPSVLDRSGSDKSMGSYHSRGSVAMLQVDPASLAPSARSSVSSAGKDWILADLLKDGKLDVDAVSGVLGLDLGFLDDPTPNSDSIFGNTSHLSETGSPAKEGMGWGRAAQDGSTSFDMQIRKPGGPLFVIPEETEEFNDVGSSRRGSKYSMVSGSASARYSRGYGNQSVHTSWIAS